MKYNSFDFGMPTKQRQLNLNTVFFPVIYYIRTCAEELVNFLFHIISLAVVLFFVFYICIIYAYDIVYSSIL